ncbi:MAG: 30S ribosomal protein S4 [Thermaerobacter sp.]|nr:30S ribosomal protein S4 [Thermaerobacter sp.]
MARNTGPTCRLCRREGMKLFLKGDRCFSDKCPIVKKQRNQPPGQHGLGRRKMSEYGIQLREKQKVRRFYGVLETQFRRYVDRAQRSHGRTGDVMLSLLERRLDNVIYRMGFALSRPEARQLVRHGHFSVNGQKVSIPSYLIRQGDEIEVRSRSRERASIKEIIERGGARPTPEWVEVQRDQYKGRIVRLPERGDVDVPVEEHLIVELYSR